MKILAIHSVQDDPNTTSAVDLWRIKRPIDELKKHVDWQIDEQPTFIRGIEKYKDEKEFTEQELEKAAKFLGQYDIVFSSYFLNHTPYTLMKAVEKRYGTKLVLDIDDDMFSVNPDNPFWVKANDEQVWWVQCMIRDCNWVTTTTQELAEVFRKRREQPADTVVPCPNFISDDYKEYDPNNEDQVVIGYFGGASHFTDINETKVIEAVAKIMHEHKNVRFKTVGVPVDKYIPTARHEFVDGKKGVLWAKELFPTLNMDIVIAPLLDNTFNYGKSDIKWQESTRMGSAFVASNIGPYSKLPQGTALLAEDTVDDWYKKLKMLVEDAGMRKHLVGNARKELEKRRLEKSWGVYKRLFERVKASK